MTVDAFKALMAPVLDAVAARPLDGALADHLNATFPADGETVAAITSACHDAIAAGWMCDQGPPNCRYGRVVDPAPDTHGLSIDVVDLTDIAGPHHSHPKGEVCLTMPVTEGARFDGMGAGWCVNEPGSAHSPTVADGQALVLYLLPEGEITFTRR